MTRETICLTKPFFHCKRVGLIRWGWVYNNTPSNATVNAASNISCMTLLEADVFAVLFMNELKKVVIRNFGKLVHKQNCSHDFFLFFINNNIIIVL